MVSQTVAEFVASADPESLPPEVSHAVKRSLLNFFATALEGTHDIAVETALKTMLPFAGMSEATLIGRAERTDAMTAAFINSAAANVHDFDDTHIRTVIHPTAPVAPPLLALSELRLITGREFINALALGIEFTCRIGNAISPEHYARGWHITATCGVLGAALGVGKLLNLEANKLVFALGSASAQASGLVETLGFMAKSIGVGGSARGALLAGLLAENNFNGPSAPLEGVRGFLNVTGADPQLDEITSDLGTRWETLRNIHKPYPCGIVINAVIDGCLKLRECLTVPVEEINSIKLSGHSLLLQRANRPDVQTGRESQVSAQHAAAVSLIFGQAGLEEFTDATVNDPRVRTLAQKVTLEVAPNTPLPDVHIEVIFANKSSEKMHVKDARGTDNGPLSDADIESKFQKLARCTPNYTHAEQLIEAVWQLDKNNDISTLLKETVP